LWKIREAISKATTLEEVERLNKMLQAGQIPGQKQNDEASKYIFYLCSSACLAQNKFSKSILLGLSLSFSPAVTCLFVKTVLV